MIILTEKNLYWLILLAFIWIFTVCILFGRDSYEQIMYKYEHELLSQQTYKVILLGKVR